jgi:acetyl esterase/lipase
VAQLLAQHGMAAVAISYRLAPQDKFPAQIEDCKEAVRWMRSNAEQFRVDAKRIGAFGYSAGAHLAALLGTTDAADGLEGLIPAEAQVSTRIQAVAGGGAPCDFRSLPLDMRWLSYWLGGTRRDAEEQYRLASPAAFITPDDPPMFFFHGETDTLVPLVSPRQMCDSLHQAGVPAELYVVPKIGHAFAVMDRTAISKSVAFLAATLQSEPER